MTRGNWLRSLEYPYASLESVVKNYARLNCIPPQSVAAEIGVSWERIANGRVPDAKVLRVIPATGAFWKRADYFFGAPDPQISAVMFRTDRGRCIACVACGYDSAVFRFIGFSLCPMHNGKLVCTEPEFSQAEPPFRLIPSALEKLHVAVALIRRMFVEEELCARTLVLRRSPEANIMAGHLFAAWAEAGVVPAVKPAMGWATHAFRTIRLRIRRLEPDTVDDEWDYVSDSCLQAYLWVRRRVQNRQGAGWMRRFNRELVVAASGRRFSCRFKAAYANYRFHWESPATDCALVGSPLGNRSQQARRLLDRVQAENIDYFISAWKAPFAAPRVFAELFCRSFFAHVCQHDSRAAETRDECPTMFIVGAETGTDFRELIEVRSSGNTRPIDSPPRWQEVRMHSDVWTWISIIEPFPVKRRASYKKNHY